MHIKVCIYRKLNFVRYIGALKQINKIQQNKKDLLKKFKEYEAGEVDIPIDSCVLNSFKKAFIKFSWQQHRDMDIWREFLEKDIYIVKKSNQTVEPKEPILICIIKDDLIRLKMLLNHYRDLGVKKFAFLDNNSSDGTFEYLKEQDDVDLFLCKTKYTTLNRESWVNKIIAYYGFDRWYICVDSDEMLVFKDEKTTLSSAIEKAEQNGRRRIRGMLLDMYCKDENLPEETPLQIKTKYSWFDKNSYTVLMQDKIDAIRGGPRSRIFGKSGVNQFLLTKYPLFYFVAGDIQGSSHFQFPYDENYGLDLECIIKHYKFLNNDSSKYEARAKSGSYASGSLEYKSYMEKIDISGKVYFYDPKYSTNSLDEIQILDKDRFGEVR